MDIKGLSDLFNSGNWSLIQPAMQQYEADMAKTQATTAGLVGQEKRAAEMQPFDIGHKKALTRQSEVTSNATQNRLDVEQGVPLADRQKAYWAELMGKSQDANANALKNNMEALRHYTAIAKQRPLSLEELNEVQTKYKGMEKFLVDPKAIAAGEAAYKHYVESSPDYMKAAMQADQRLKGVQAGVAARGSGGGSKSTEPQKLSAEQAMTYHQRMAAQYPAGSAEQLQHQAEADRYELIMYRKMREAAAARNVGEVDISKVGKNGVPVVQEKPLAPTPRAGSPAKPASLPPLPPGAKLD
jgi:hypothetical protein